MDPHIDCFGLIISWPFLDVPFWFKNGSCVWSTLALICTSHWRHQSQSQQHNCDRSYHIFIDLMFVRITSSQKRQSSRAYWLCPSERCAQGVPGATEMNSTEGYWRLPTLFYWISHLPCFVTHGLIVQAVPIWPLSCNEMKWKMLRHTEIWRDTLQMEIFVDEGFNWKELGQCSSIVFVLNWNSSVVPLLWKDSTGRNSFHKSFSLPCTCTVSIVLWHEAQHSWFVHSNQLTASTIKRIKDAHLNWDWFIKELQPCRRRHAILGQNQDPTEQVRMKATETETSTLTC